MFDPLFPIALFPGLLALAFLLRIEAKRIRRSIRPLFASFVLAPIAVWGLIYLGIILADVLFGEGMKVRGLHEVTTVAISASIGIVVCGYELVFRHRRQDLLR